MKPMKYKGYSASIEYSDEDECLVGRVIGINDIVTFHGESVDEVRQAFHESIDFYLESCRESGEKPNRSYSGKLLLRLPTEVHAAIANAAESNKQSINQWAVEQLSKAGQS